MSRLLRLRSPWMIKVNAEEGKVLSAATADIFIWKGKLTDKPATRNYRLNKQVIGSQDYIIFEVSEMARDEIQEIFTGNTRETEPVYINVAVAKANTDGTVDGESFFVTGLDGWGYYADGIQASQNLLREADLWPNINADDELIATLTSNLDDIANPNLDRTLFAGEGSGVVFTCGVNPAAATITWQKDGDDIDGQTGSTYSITSISTDSVGGYTCTATNADDETDVSNELSIEIDNNFLVINPSSISLSQKIGGSNTNNVMVDLIYEATSPDITDDDVDNADALFTSFAIGDTVTAFGKKTTKLNVWANKTNVSTTTQNSGPIKITYNDVEHDLNVTQALLDGVNNVFVLNPSIDAAGVTSSNQIKVTVQGNIGSQYQLSLIDVDPIGWTSAGQALNTLKGTVGTTTHYIDNIPELFGYTSRKFRILAENLLNPEDFATSQVITQYPQTASIVIKTNSLPNFDADGEDMEIEVYNTAPGTLRIEPTGSNHFRFVFTDPNFPAGEYTTLSYNISDINTFDDPFTISVRAPENIGDA